MATFPTTMAMSLPIQVGTDSKSPYQWAAALAPEGKVVEYKNAMLWLEGENFGSQSEFLAKVDRIIKYQNEENHRPVATITPPVVVKETTTTDTDSGDDGWGTVKSTRRPPKPKVAFLRWTKQQVAKAIVDGCVREMERVFSFTGPSLYIKDVYPQFDTKEFTFGQLIGAVRDELGKLPAPGKNQRYNAATSPGKGNNFNVKVQKPDKTKPNGWSAVAQIHVIWG